MNYSVLMSVYHKEKPEHLRESLSSIFEQTKLTNDFVLVCDGPLTEDLDNVIAQAEAVYGNIMHTIRLDKNVGLGRALNIGLGKCKNNVVARMDADDIAKLDRCEKQLALFKQNKDLDIVSATVEEFDQSPEQVHARRILPEHHEEIVDYAKKRCPFNHPCVMYKKSTVELAGGYQHFYLLEDYYLWVRMLLNGAISYNLQEPLLWMRTGSNMYQRRGGLKYAKSLIQLLRYMREQKFINSFQYLQLVIVRTTVSLMPNSARRYVYNSLLRKQA